MAWSDILVKKNPGFPNLRLSFPAGSCCLASPWEKFRWRELRRFFDRHIFPSAMSGSGLHRWDVVPAEAARIQRRLAARVVLQPLKQGARLVAGADLAFSRDEKLVVAAVVMLELPRLEVVEEAFTVEPLSFPYVPGLLSFREGPALLKAIAKLRRQPDAFIFDGQGIAHPRRLGLASHLGLWLRRPTVGCAKSRLCGDFSPPGPEKGACSSLRDGGQRLGSVLRTRAGVRPVFVSPGHLCDFRGAVELVLACCGRYRLPEPTRLADILAGAKKKEIVGD